MEPTQQLTEKQHYWHEYLERARYTNNCLVAYAKEQYPDVKTLYHYQSVLRQKRRCATLSQIHEQYLNDHRATKPTVRTSF